MKKPSQNPIILIPARMASTRLPNKPLAQIGDAPMIGHVYRRAKESGLARVVVACDSEEIKQVIEAEGGEAVITDADLPSGSDRIWQALQKVDAEGKHDIIINLQGDMPTLDPAIIEQVIAPLENDQIDIATLAAVITEQAEITNPNIVKIAMSGERTILEPGDELEDCTLTVSAGEHAHALDEVVHHGEIEINRALYFSRAPIPYCEDFSNETYYHHIGIYAYRRKSLQKFIALPPSTLEMREKLEQLRALEAGMNIAVSIVDTVPLGVDTAEQLEQARKILSS